MAPKKYCKLRIGAMENCPWATKIEAFDFKSKTSYSIQGFPSLQGAWQYMEAWNNEALQDAWERKVRLRVLTKDFSDFESGPWNVTHRLSCNSMDRGCNCGRIDAE